MSRMWDLLAIGATAGVHLPLIASSNTTLTSLDVATGTWTAFDDESAFSVDVPALPSRGVFILASLLAMAGMALSAWRVRRGRA